MDIPKPVLLGEVYIKAAQTLLDSGDYGQAEKLMQNLLEQISPDQSSGFAGRLSFFAESAYGRGKFSVAEFFYRYALLLSEKSCGKEDSSLGIIITALADCYVAQGMFSDAEQFYYRALTIFQSALGKEHLNVVLVLCNLADVYNSKGDGQAAEKVLAKAREILENVHVRDEQNVFDDEAGD